MTSNEKPSDFNMWMHEERLTVSEYLRLQKEFPGSSRPMVIKDRSREIIRHGDKLRARTFHVDKLLDVLRSSEVDPDSQDFGEKSQDQIVNDLALYLIEILAEDEATKERYPHVNARSGAMLEDGLVNEVVLALIEQFTMEIPMALLSLLQMRLDPKLANRTPRQSTGNERARAAVEIALNSSLSTRQLAKIIGVNQSTISRWKKETEFKELVAKLNVSLKQP